MFSNVGFVEQCHSIFVMFLTFHLFSSVILFSYLLRASDVVDIPLFAFFLEDKSLTVFQFHLNKPFVHLAFSGKKRVFVFLYWYTVSLTVFSSFEEVVLRKY